MNFCICTCGNSIENFIQSKFTTKMFLYQQVENQDVLKARATGGFIPNAVSGALKIGLDGAQHHQRDWQCGVDTFLAS